MTVKTRNIMYTQQMTKLPFADIDALMKRVTDALKPQDLAWIVHDKDDGVDPHIHLMMHFENARSLSSVASKLNDREQQLTRFDNANNGWSYLVHATAKSRDKYQYDPYDVRSNFNYAERLKKISKNVSLAGSRKDSEIIDEVLNQLEEGIIDERMAYETLTGAQWGKAHQKIKAVVREKQVRDAEEWIKQRKRSKQPIQVIWLFGESGTGKSTLAKKYASDLDDDYYISGSSKDPFQFYKGQEVVILDELRSESFSYDDLLKLLDPYGEGGAAPSRFFDKPLKASTIFITTPLSPLQFYNGFRALAGSDNYPQLARRLSLVQKVCKDKLVRMTFNERKGWFEDGEEIDNPLNGTMTNSSLYDDVQSVDLFERINK